MWEENIVRTHKRWLVLMHCMFLTESGMRWSHLHALPREGKSATAGVCLSTMRTQLCVLQVKRSWEGSRISQAFNSMCNENNHLTNEKTGFGWWIVHVQQIRDFTTYSFTYLSAQPLVFWLTHIRELTWFVALTCCMCLLLVFVVWLMVCKPCAWLDIVLVCE